MLSLVLKNLVALPLGWGVIVAHMKMGLGRKLPHPLSAGGGGGGGGNNEKLAKTGRFLPWNDKITKLKQYCMPWKPSMPDIVKTKSIAIRRLFKRCPCGFVSQAPDFCTAVKVKSGVWSGSEGSSLNHTKLPPQFWIMVSFSFDFNTEQAEIALFLEGIINSIETLTLEINI